MNELPAKRYEISRASIWIDRAMNRFIKVGGISIIVAVFAIFLFILFQILPLFRGASVGAAQVAGRVPEGFAAAAIGADEWLTRPFAMDAQGRVVFLEAGSVTSSPPIAPKLPAGVTVSAFAYDPRTASAALGLSDGRCAVVELGYAASFVGTNRTIRARVETSPPLDAGIEDVPVRLVSVASQEGEKMVVVAQDGPSNRPIVRVAVLTRTTSLMGAGRFEPSETIDLSSQIEGRPVQVLVNHRLDGVIVRSEEGLVHFFYRQGGEFRLQQKFRPFDATPIASMDLLFGDDSLIITDTRGQNVCFSLYVAPAQSGRRFGLTKRHPALPAGATAFAPSLRNKSFLVVAGQTASLRFNTTVDQRWETTLPFKPVQAALGRKHDAVLLLGDDGLLRSFALRDPHPEASWRGFFGKIWYEGSPAPKYEWQSTAASDDFEPKLSMVPLLIGTLKGTLYAMLFSVPLALLAALYTSQFAHPNLRRFIKPVMEIMASLPSVILGFLAAIWLAPILETRVPSLLLALFAIPAACMAFGALWSRMPFRVRRSIRDGHEFLVALPIVLLAGWAAWQLGPALERMLFVATDPASGHRIADFRMWWPQVTGAPFEQRNSLVVGFMMGFAVIPIIFTITEDALSNVPAAFRSASLALGASRWQTAIRVMLPTASAGLFSAVMIGFGRAVGETMIVLMATGNTAVMDFNIFSGMRTLSANIAVELPEAPVGGTLYRALYLGAMLLFLMTFAVNTLAEILRHHLREKFKAV